MGGGPSTPALAAAVSEAGGLGFLAAGYRTPDAVRSGIAELRELTPRPFGLGIFVPGRASGDSAELERYAALLAGEAEALGVELGEPRYDDDDWEDKLDLASEEHVPVVGFTFGCPDASVVRRLQADGCAIWVTVTTAAEAVAAADGGADALIVQGVEAGGHRGSYDAAAPGDDGLLALLQLVRAVTDRPLVATGGIATGRGVAAVLAAGADALIVQGFEAGGHRAAFVDEAPGDIGLLALLQLVRAVTDRPLVATGGIATGRGVAAVLAAGAAAAQLGTAFMRTPEAATSEAHREAFRGEAPTALTRAFTGRTARGIENRFMREHEQEAPLAYPEVHNLTAPLRAAARERGDADAFNLWAGQAYPLAEELPAGELVRKLAAEAREVLRAAARKHSG